MRHNERRGGGVSLRCPGRGFTLLQTLVVMFVIVTFAIPFGAAATASSETPIFVSQINFSGNTQFSDAALQALVQDAKGNYLTIAELEAVAERITRAYRQAGYIGSRAYLPAQRIEGGVVRIAILEARYGAIRVDNQSHLRDGVIAQHLAALQSGQPVVGGLLQERIASLSSLAGVRARSALSAGQETGTSDLLVTVTDSPRLSGYASLNNSGTRLTGNARMNLNAYLNNVSGAGDRLSTHVTSGGLGFNYGRLAYELPWGPLPLHLGLAYTAVQYRLGAEFDKLDAHGLTQQVEATAGAPLVVRGSKLFDWQADFRYKHIQDNLLDDTKDKQIIGLTLGIEGSGKNLLSNARELRNTYSLAWTAGRLNIDSAPELLIDQATLKTHGVFHKITGESTLVATIDARTDVVGSVRAQLAFKNLDLTEKFTLGGPTGVRAYPAGEASGDEGVLVSLELRRLQPLNGAHRLQGVLFADAGRVRLNKNPHDATAQNQRTLYATGIGLAWSAGDFTASSHYGWRLGSEKATADTDHGGRFWAQTTYRF